MNGKDDPASQLAAALGEFKEEASGLLSIFKGALPGGGRQAVAPLGPLPRSPILAAADPGSVVTPPHREPPKAPSPFSPTEVPPDAQQAERHNPFAEVPSPVPIAPLIPLWVSTDRTERIASNGRNRLAYEQSCAMDECGEPVWGKVALPFSAKAAAALAGLIGVALSIRPIAAFLRALATEKVLPEEAASAARRIMQVVGIPTAGPIMTFEASTPPCPLPDSVFAVPTAEVLADEPLDGWIVEVQHDPCALIIVTVRGGRPRVGDKVSAKSGANQDWVGPSTFGGRVVQVVAKDIGYDLTVKVERGQAAPGPIFFERN